MIKHIALFFKHFNINIVHEGLTISSIAHRLMMTHAKPYLPFSIPKLPFVRSCTVGEAEKFLEILLYKAIKMACLGGQAVKYDYFLLHAQLSVTFR